ncbi:hypothetical protein MELE44368_11165 [Mycolicibacterium elephantis DSM 44368]|uniref:Uncharacterized protein n=1 Tax=Mycolicibacterium elephantis DSM 44368 TaxID=1335622 RepID=A0A439DZN4_9MYCO|nr:hypothetical protein MELE44368_11165 [Mycolicibacterium elephantis DSM 44368]
MKFPTRNGSAIGELLSSAVGEDQHEHTSDSPIRSHIERVGDGITGHTGRRRRISSYGAGRQVRAFSGTGHNGTLVIYEALGLPSARRDRKT